MYVVERTLRMTLLTLNIRLYRSICSTRFEKQNNYFAEKLYYALRSCCLSFIRYVNATSCRGSKRFAFPLLWDGFEIIDDVERNLISSIPEYDRYPKRRLFQLQLHPDSRKTRKKNERKRGLRMMCGKTRKK